jgi:hypothetical protein
LSFSRDYYLGPRVARGLWGAALRCCRRSDLFFELLVKLYGVPKQLLQTDHLALVSDRRHTRLHTSKREPDR